MPRIVYPPTSPYAQTPQSSWAIGRYSHRPIAPDGGDAAVTITHRAHLRPDRLSQDLYGTPNHWWVFMLRNMDIIRDPIWDFTAGTTIMVPSAGHLTRLLGA